MKRYLAALILLLSSYLSATTITTTQPIQDPRGGRLNGKIVFALPAPATNIPLAAVIMPVARPVSVVNGLLVGTLTLPGNDILSPKMYYNAYYYDSAGRPLAQYHYYISGTTFDLGNAPLTPVTTSNISQMDWQINNLLLNNSLTVLGNVTETAGQNTINAYQFNRDLWVDGVKYTSIAACYADIPTATYSACGDGIGTCWTGGGGVCHVPARWVDPTWSADLTLKNNASIVFHGPATMNQSTFKVKAAGGIHGVSIINPYRDHSQRTSGVVFDYSGSGDQWQIGDGTSFVSDITIQSIQIHCIDGSDNCNPLHIHSAQYSNIIDNDLVCANAGTNTGNGLLFDGTTTSNYQNTLADNVVNFCNAPVKFTGTNTDNTWDGLGGAVGNPHGTAGVAFDIGGTSVRNQFRHPQLLNGTAAYTKFFQFSNTSSGNEVWADNGNGGATLTVDFASSSNNRYNCLAGTCSVTDTGTGNVVNDPTTKTILHRTNDNNNFGPVTLYAVPATGAGTYRIHAYEIVTTVAGTSSTLPTVVIGWTDQDNNTAQTISFASGSASGNTLTVDNFGTFIINAKASTNITIQTTGYASNAANVMKYSTTITWEKMFNY